MPLFRNPQGLFLTAGSLLVHLMFWASCALSIALLCTDYRRLRGTGALFLLLVLAASLPLFSSFGYIKHVSLFICAVTLFCYQAFSREPAEKV